jgi:LysM repeat protein
VILTQVLEEMPTSLRERREEFEIRGRAAIPAAWEETIAACLAKDPAQRPQTAGEVLRRLTAPPRQGGSSAPPLDGIQPSPAERPIHLRPKAVSIKAPPPPPSGSWAWLIVLAVCAAVAGGAYHFRAELLPLLPGAKPASAEEDEADELPAATSPVTSYRSYAVKRGDSLHSIATLWGVTSREISAANAFVAKHPKPGVVLRIPVHAAVPASATPTPPPKPTPTPKPTPRPATPAPTPTPKPATAAPTPTPTPKPTPPPTPRPTPMPTPVALRPIFDGRSLAGWRGSSSEALPPSTTIVFGALRAREKTVLLTRESFDDFELEFEWKTEPGANGGLIYRVRPGDDPVQDSAVSMQCQLMDDGTKDPWKTGSLHGVVPRIGGVGFAVKQWHTGRIVVQGTRGEHYLDGHLVCRYDTASDAFRTQLAASKAPRVHVPGWGVSYRGPIGLEFWAGEMAYRNIRVRPLSAH